MSLLRPTVALGIAVLALLAPAARTPAQTVVGRVTEEGTLAPLRGVFVVLEAEDGTRRRRGVLTGEDGRYVLPAAPGRFRILAELIGYATTRSAVVSLESGVTVRQDIEVPIEAVTLDGIEVETGARCRRRPGAGEATARLWEEARKALEVARWGEKGRLFQFRAVEFDRDIDVRTGEVKDSTNRGLSRISSGSLYRSIPAAELAEHGYVHFAPDGAADYYAPDAEVLLSESFLDTHCFVVRAPPSDEPDLIGLGFEPIPGRDVPDIVGALWLQRGTAELRRLDFSYRGLPSGYDWEPIGGRVDFARLSTGVWVVESWVVRMPMELRAVGGFGNSRSELELAVLREHGAQVRTIAGGALSTAAGGALYGVVSLPDGAPLAGALITLAGTEHRTLSASDGTYRISGIPAGTYIVRISHPELTLAGIAPHGERVAVVSGRAERFAYALPLTAELADSVCTDWGQRPKRGAATVVYGVVKGENGRPLPGAALRLGSPDGSRLLLADSVGGYRGCVRASRSPAGIGLDSVSAVRMEVPVRSPGFVRADLVVPGG